ncbi:hypothetical protein SLNSH_14935 [Alsobacter soli]|uniref:Uncharacterized protein n=1 Tax=Alsobacter soli TaxID=2109933 RepID=A0A2T1HRM7_9HYPH|nr:hypothetical protein [Alsobacter soli]PSC04282.1 hypothetical protein SLNSH_14935 [Alsobacter soli]
MSTVLKTQEHISTHARLTRELGYAAAAVAVAAALFWVTMLTSPPTTSAATGTMTAEDAPWPCQTVANCP